MDADCLASVVIDNGSGSCKAGYAIQPSPSIFFPCIAGRPQTGFSLAKDLFVGPEAQVNREILNLSYPIKYGQITDWDAMEKIWYHILINKLEVSTENHPVLVTEAPLANSDNRDKMLQILFETFDVPGVSVGIRPVLSLHASNRLSGVVLMSGDWSTRSVPIYEGHIFKQNVMRLDAAGKDINDLMILILRDRNHTIETPEAKEAINQIKETMCYLRINESEATPNIRHSYTLPDGTVITLDDEILQSPKAIFQPSLVGLKSYGVHQLVFNSIMLCDEVIRKVLFSNIVLAGGSTLFKGFGDCVKAKIASLAPSSVKIDVVQPIERRFTAWIGGCIMATSSAFKLSWISKNEYYESGSSGNQD